MTLRAIPPACRALLPGLRARASRPPLVPRQALLLPDGRAIGSIEPALATRLEAAGLVEAVASGAAGSERAAAALAGPGPAWQVPVGVGDAGGALDDRLAAIAHWMRNAGLTGRWRDEPLDVTTAAGEVVGAIERAAVRPLGITTFAVHLIGIRPDGCQWVQQRALDKATDPGLWDTLMGGLRGAGESVHETLERETWEEAGLGLADLQALRHAGRITMRRPVVEGYLIEHLDLFEAVVPAGLEPANRDGEVARFACFDEAALAEHLAADRFTLEAALMLCGAAGDA
jgi:8-oxo-dGTP pyrophosphatase MutT (NUDIX family)